MPFFDIAIRKPFVKALVGRKGKGNKGTGADTGKQRRPSWVRLGRSIAAKGKLQSQERLRRRSSVAGTLRMASSTPCLHLEPAGGQPNGTNTQNHDNVAVEEGHELARSLTRMPHGASPREARYSLSAADDSDFDNLNELLSARPESSLSFGGHAVSEASDSSFDTATPSEGTATPVNNLSRSPSYKKGGGYIQHSPFHSPASSPLAEHPPRYPYYGLRLVPRAEDRAPQDEYFDGVLATLPSFRPLHPAIAFDDEGEGE